MYFQDFKTNLFCVDGRHRSATTNIYGDITSEGSKVLICYCSICNRKKSMTVTDNTKQAEGLGDSFKILCEKGLNVSKKMAKKRIKEPGRSLDITANIASAVASRNVQAASPTLPKVINF